MLFGNDPLVVEEQPGSREAISMLLPPALSTCSLAAGGGDGLQSGHARADDEDARRRNGARGGGQHGKHSGKPVGGQQHGPVAADGGH